MRILPNANPWRDAKLEIEKTDDKSNQDIRITALFKGPRPVRIELTTEEALDMCNRVADLIES